MGTENPDEINLAGIIDDPANPDLARRAIKHFVFRELYEELFLSILRHRYSSDIDSDKKGKELAESQRKFAKICLENGRYHERFFHGVFKGIGGDTQLGNTTPNLFKQANSS